MQVRRAAAEDAGQIAEVHVASWRAAYRGLLPDDLIASLDVSLRERRWRSILHQPEWTLLVAGEQATSAVVGFACCGPSRDDDAEATTGEVTAIYAHPDVWGRGVGAALLSASTATLASRYLRATLWVLDTNSRARDFYERLGWRADGAVKHEEREGFTLVECRYRLDLADAQDG